VTRREPAALAWRAGGASCKYVRGWKRACISDPELQQQHLCSPLCSPLCSCSPQPSGCPTPAVGCCVISAMASGPAHPRDAAPSRGGDAPSVAPSGYETVFTNAKAGMEGVDKDHVKHVVYTMSKVGCHSGPQITSPPPTPPQLRDMPVPPPRRTAPTSRTRHASRRPRRSASRACAHTPPRYPRPMRPRTRAPPTRPPLTSRHPATCLARGCTSIWTPSLLPWKNWTAPRCAADRLRSAAWA
jgi:hypothetical protein